YGDVALNSGGRAILTGRLDRLLDFDPTTGVLVAEAGVRLDDLRRVFLPRGFLAPVTPGTAFATLGGAFANDVHGKNHDRAGGFGEHVLWADLVLPSGESVRISPDEQPELFAASLGGMGLTGILSRLARVLMPSGSVALEERPMPDVDPFLAAFEAAGRSATYSVGWIDALARGKELGRGILETAEPAPAGAPASRARRRRVPFDLPGMALN